MEMEILHNFRGDKKKNFDTTTEKGRQEAAITINKMLNSGTAIFLERGKKTYRVKGYDPKKDVLTVEAAVRGQDKRVHASGRKSKTAAVAPVAGGVS